MDFKRERVNCHNKFPEIVQFKAEIKFREKLEKARGVTPFTPIHLGYGEDATYQTCVGHLIDGLEFLPSRPDYMFDHCFKVMDEAGGGLFPGQGIKGIAQGLGGELLNNAPREWQEIINLLGTNIPIMTCRFLVKRICEAHHSSDRNINQLSKRAASCFGTKFYSEFIGKFSLDDQGNPTGNISIENINKGASFLKLYLSGSKGTRKNLSTTYSKLDLTKQENLATPNKRIEFLLSLLLFNMRNERSHGAVLSPFRTSKSSIDRYQSYYFAMLCAYVFCLGTMMLNNFGSLTSEKILECTEANITLQKAFFS